MKSVKFALILFVFSFSAAQAQVCQYQTKKNGGGAWTTASTWTVTKISGTGTCPNTPNAATHSVIIDEKDLVTLSGVSSIIVSNLTLNDGQGSTDTRLTINAVNVQAKGNFTLGAKTQVTVSGGADIKVTGNLQFDANNGNIDIDGASGGGTLLVEGCADGAGGSDNPGLIINSGITWCVGPSGNCSASGLGSGQSSGGCNIILPVTMSYFQPVLAKDHVRLEWETVSEAGSDYFQVEKSHDGKDFKAIGEIDAAGYSEATISYSFEDWEMQEGDVYYRLKQVDIDGSFSYTKVVQLFVSLENQAAASAYPNPSANGLFMIKSASPIEAIDVVDLMGRPIAHTQMRQGKLVQVQFNQPKAGTYLVRVKTANDSQSVKVSVE